MIELESLSLLKDMINEQTFIDEIKEWIIVDGSKGINKITKFDIQKLQKDFKPTIIFGEFDENCITIGKLRNKTNDLATGNIIVCMDDDDYYPPTRVEEAYSNLLISKKLIAGCNITYFYDFCLEKEFKMVNKVTHGDNHSHNNSMAYKREYLTNHRYNDESTFAEEDKFTNKFSEPMEHLNPNKSVTMSSHISNTYNKRLNIYHYYNQSTINIHEINYGTIPKKYLSQMKKIFIKTHKSKYDIVYLCGPSPLWDPRDESLGGSEQAVKYLTYHFTTVGFKVAVYGNVTEMNYAGTEYINWLNFPYHEEFNNVIIWRLLGLSFVSYTKLKAKRIFYDLHDNMRYINSGLHYTSFLKNNKLDYIMFKSNYHKAEFETSYNIGTAKPLIILNGLRIPEMNRYISSLLSTTKEVRSDLRFCYCSCYTRGLEYILRWIWPEIIKAEPRAELHIYYGTSLIRDEKFKNMIYQLIGSSVNVMNHEKQPLEIIAQEKCKSSFHLYPTQTPLEVDCISIRESILCGCIPVLLNVGVFIEREGLKFESDVILDGGEETMKKYAEMLTKLGVFIGQLLKNKDQINKIRKTLENSKLLSDWKIIANQWVNYFNI